MKNAYVALAAILALTPAKADDINGNAEMGRTIEQGWEVSAWQDPGTERFSHCSASSTYNLRQGGKFSLFVQTGNDGALVFKILHQRWEPVSGKPYKVQLQFDQDVYTLKGFGTDGGSIQMTIDPESYEKFLNEFSLANMLGVRVNNSTQVVLRMDGSARAVERVLECWRTGMNMNGEVLPSQRQSKSVTPRGPKLDM